MDRTLFNSAMIDTFRVCRRAYQFAFGAAPVDKVRLSAICKKFLVRAVVEIHKGRLVGLPQVQKYLGQHWPAERLSSGENADMAEMAVEAFRFVYRVLTHYVSAPYKPKGAECVLFNYKQRGRVPHIKVYLEEVFDLVYWHPETATLELVDFHLAGLKPFDPAWPATSLLIKYYLAQRLRARWPFQRVAFTMVQLHKDGHTPVTIELDDTLFRVHWPAVLKTLEEMKNPSDFAPHRTDDICKRCKFLGECNQMDQTTDNSSSDVSLSA